MPRPDKLYPNYIHPKTVKWGQKHVSVGGLGIGSILSFFRPFKACKNFALISFGRLFLYQIIWLWKSLGLYTDKSTIYSMELFEGDSFYEYLIKTYLYTNKEDTVALEMYKDALEGIENKLVK